MVRLKHMIHWGKMAWRTLTSSLTFFYGHLSLVALSLVPSSFRAYQMWHHLDTPFWMEAAVELTRVVLFLMMIAFDWCIMDDDMKFDQFLSTIDAIFYGRVSYDEWGHYQPAIEADNAEKNFWEDLHSKKKYVFSSQENSDDRATFIRKDIAGEVAEIKHQRGKDIWLYGGAGLIRTFSEMGLIDIYRLSVHPVVLGNGLPLFKNLKERLELQLLDAHKFQSGVVQLIYQHK